ncbi:MAG: hypothetical protein MPK30_05795, partial [Gammaproteobacteria bacterium]|nr:hypothetical protein [Gammaproteobacteria bacterium]
GKRSGGNVNSRRKIAGEKAARKIPPKIPAETAEIPEPCRNAHQKPPKKSTANPLTPRLTGRRALCIILRTIRPFNQPRKSRKKP